MKHTITQALKSQTGLNGVKGGIPGHWTTEDSDSDSILSVDAIKVEQHGEGDEATLPKLVLRRQNATPPDLLDETPPNTPAQAQAHESLAPRSKRIKKEPKGKKEVKLRPKKVFTRKYNQEKPPEHGIRVPRQELDVKKVYGISYPELLDNEKHGHHRKKYFVLIDYVDQYGHNRICNVKFGEWKRKPNLKFKPAIDDNILDPKFWYYSWYAAEPQDRREIYFKIREANGLTDQTS